jgi:hypothetical protein
MVCKIHCCIKYHIILISFYSCKGAPLFFFFVSLCICSDVIMSFWMSEFWLNLLKFIIKCFNCGSDWCSLLRRENYNYITIQVEEEILMCKPLPTLTTGEDTFNLTDLCMAEKGLSWKQSVDICTDGMWSMVGKKCGFVAHVECIAPECTSSHCVIHHQALVKRFQTCGKWC